METITDDSSIAYVRHTKEHYDIRTLILRHTICNLCFLNVDFVFNKKTK